MHMPLCVLPYTGDGIVPLISQDEDVLKKIVTLIDVINKLQNYSLLNTAILQVPDCRTFTHYQIDSDALPRPINENIEYPLTMLNFSLPSDIITNVTVTITSLAGVDLIFQNIAIRTL